jgi:protein-disulfide isomerase
MSFRVFRQILIVVAAILLGAALPWTVLPWAPPFVAAQATLLPARGEPSGSMVILLFSDFQCESCAKAEATLKQVRDAFPKDVQVIFKHNPTPDHADAPLAHELAIEAARQGKFWEMHDLLLHHQDALTPMDLMGYAEQLGLDVERFTGALQTQSGATRIAEDVDSADLSGVSGTPTFFVNGRRHYGAYDIATLTAAVREARVRAELGR